MPRTRQRSVGPAAAIVAVALAAATPAWPDPPAAGSGAPRAAASGVLPNDAADPSSALFEGPIRTLRLTIAEADVARLRDDPRGFVPADLGDGSATLRVAVRIKGSAGSLRDIDDRPALTVDVDRIDPSNRYHGLVRFHLNNSVQDPGLLNEWLATELFREAGIPATRVTHARVELNGRDLGLFVLKESFDTRFLRRHFADPSGNLYEGGFIADIDSDLKRDEGRGVEDRSDLRGVVEARLAARDDASLAALAERVDLDALLRFMAIERLIGHWDGYCGSANNYRVYFDPGRGGRMIFLPHGMDQVFEDPHATLFEETQPLLASAVMRFDAWRDRYRATLRDLVPKLLDPTAIGERVARIDGRLRPAVAALGDEALRDYDERRDGLLERLRERHAFLTAPGGHLDESDPAPRPIAAGHEEQLEEWFDDGDPERVRFSQAEGIHALTISGRASGPDADSSEAAPPEAVPPEAGTAAWRGAILLPRGRYVIESDVRLVEGLLDEECGVSLVTSAGPRSSILRTPGDALRLRAPLDIPEDRRLVTYALEIRLYHGRVTSTKPTIRRIDEPTSEQRTENPGQRSY